MFCFAILRYLTRRRFDARCSPALVARGVFAARTAAARAVTPTTAELRQVTLDHDPRGRRCSLAASNAATLRGGVAAAAAAAAAGGAAAARGVRRRCAACIARCIAPVTHPRAAHLVGRCARERFFSHTSWAARKASSKILTLSDIFLSPLFRPVATITAVAAVLLIRRSQPDGSGSAAAAEPGHGGRLFRDAVKTPPAARDALAAAVAANPLAQAASTTPAGGVVSSGVRPFTSHFSPTIPPPFSRVPYSRHSIFPLFRSGPRCATRCGRSCWPPAVGCPSAPS